MKTTLYSIIAAAAACGLASAAETAYTTPVGYETSSFAVGFSTQGLRLQSPTVAAGTLTAVTATTLEDTDVADFAAVLGASGASGTYVLEIDNGLGIYQLVSTWSGSSITVAADLTGDVAVGAPYTIRQCATLASVFGATNNVANSGAGLGAGAGGPATGSADQIWVPDGSGGYDKYYYDAFAPPLFTPSWAKVDTSAFGATAIDGNSVLLPYPVGFFMNAKTAGTVVASGEVKTSETEIDVAIGFNLVGSVAPAGATLVTAFGANNEAGLGAGAGGPATGSADQIWVPDGLGGYDKYYYDAFAPPLFTPSWAKVDTSAFGATAIDGSTVVLTSGYFINAKSTKAVTQGVPASYSGL